MGNGRWSGRSLEKRSGSLLRGIFGAMLVLLVAGAVLLGLGSHRNTSTATVQVPASPIPNLFQSSQHAKPDAHAILGQLPLIFEPNQGQADSSVKFLAHGAGYSLFLDETSAVLSMQTGHSPAGNTEQFVRMKLVGANPAAATTGTDALPGKSNYFIGNDPQKWHSGIPQFAGVHYASIYPGIDLVFYGNQGRLEYDFKVAPGADPSQAELQFDGASKLELSGGDLVLTGNNDGGVRVQAPQIYQRDGGRHVPVSGHFVLRAANRVAFEIGPYDRSRELIIDPVLQFSTYFGGSGSETSPSVAVDLAGNIYLTGTTQGSPANSFPATTWTLIPPTLSLTSTSPSHIFVTKINPTVPAIVYETFIGGSGSDTSVGIGVDGGDNAYIVGNTSSTDFPTVGLSYQTGPETKGPQCASITCTSVFVSVLAGGQTPGTTLTYSSYLSGNGNDQASGMTIDTKGDVFITGTTTSNDAPSISPLVAFPATPLPVPYQVSPKSNTQFFVTEINTGVQGILYSTYFGGGLPSTGAVANGGGIAVDPTGIIYFTGTTNFFNSGESAAGLGGSSPGTDFPIVNAYQPCLDTPPPITFIYPVLCTAPATPSPTDAFVTKLNPTAPAGAQLIFSTYLGGTGTDSGAAIALDSGAANIYLTGTTNSTDFVLPIGSGAFQGCLNNPGVVVTATSQCPAQVLCPTCTVPNTDAYVARLSNPAVSTTGTPTIAELTYFSYLGGGGNDSGASIAVDTSSNALVTGATNSGTNATAGINNPPNFPVIPSTGPIQSTLNGTQNAFFARIDTTTTTGQNQATSYATYFGGNGVDRGTSIAVDTNLNTYFAGDTNSNNGTFETFDPVQSTLKGTRNAFVVKLGTVTDLCITCVAPIFSPAGFASAGNPVTITFTVSNEGPDVATGIFVQGTVSPGVTLSSASAESGTCSGPTNNVLVCQIPTLQSGATSTVNFSVTPIGTCTSCSATAMVINANNTVTNISTTASFIASGFTMNIAPSGQIVSAGLPVKYTVTLNPTQGEFGSNVSLTCSSLPAGAAFSFSSSSVTLNGPTSTVLTITTTAQPVSTGSLGTGRGPLYALGLMVPGMALLGLGSGKRRGKKGRLLVLLTLSLLFALVLLQPACHSGVTLPMVSGTPSGTYPLTVTATSGSFSQSAPFQLTVTP